LPDRLTWTEPLWLAPRTLISLLLQVPFEFFFTEGDDQRRMIESCFPL